MLLRPLARGIALALGGFVCFALGWPISVAAPPLIGLGAATATVAVWRWERTRVVVTTEKLFVVYGTWRRRAAAVRLSRVEAIEVEQTVAGRLLGYGTLTAGALEIPYVPQPRDVGMIVARLSS